MSQRVVIIGPVESVHVRTWIGELRSREWDVRCVSGTGAAAFVRAVAHSWLHPGPPADVTIVHSLGRHALLALLCRRRGRIVVVPWGSEVVAAAGRSGRNAVAAAVLRRADLVITTSRHMADTITRMWRVLPDRVRAVSWGIDDRFLDAHPGADHVTKLRTALGCGVDDVLVLAPRGTGVVYRHDVIVRAVATARARGARLRLVSIVSSPAEDLIPAADAAGITLPTMSKSALWDLFHAADVVVSIPEADQRSTTVLEALATGTRVLTSAAPAYREIRDDGADLTLLSEPVEPALAEALKSLPRPNEHGGPWADANRDWCRTHERRSDNFDLIERLCRGEPCSSE